VALCETDEEEAPDLNRMNMSKHFLLLLTLLSAGTASAQTPRINVRVENPLAFQRNDETVAIAWPALTTRLRNLGADRVRVSDVVSGRELTTQALDANADGQIDSLLFQVSLAAKEVKQYAIEAAAASQKVVSRVHAKFVPEREDVAWENDRIAFRIYGKKLWELENLHSNGIDVWEKRTRALVLDPWYDKGHDSYHIDNGEGADFFQVGPTLGAGGIGVWRNGQLYRGDNFQQHRIVADGPIRAIFELEYLPIDAAGRKATEHKRVSIDAGSNFFRQESRFTADGNDAIDVVVGLVKRPLEAPDVVGSTSKNRDWKWLTVWGAIEKRTHGHGDLGTAVLTNKSQFVDFEEIADHYLSINRVTPGQTLVSYVGAGWTGSRDFDDVAGWWQYVDQFAQRLGAPLVVTLENAK
jgi:pectinesterase